MERRAILNTICGFLCAAGASAAVTGLVNKLPLVTQVGCGSLFLGLGGFSALLLSGHKPSDPVPDMPIREVFFYLDHDVLNAQTEKWRTVGRDLLDRLSTGRLEAWGRRIGRGNARSRHRSSQQRIDAPDWARATWTYFFFDEGVEMSTHVIVKNGPNEGETEWADIMFSRHQIRRLISWPKRLGRKAKWPDASKSVGT